MKAHILRQHKDQIQAVAFVEEDEDVWEERVLGAAGEDRWNEVESRAPQSSVATEGEDTSGCHQYMEQGACEARGCTFTREEGMVICAKRRDPLGVPKKGRDRLGAKKYI